MGSMDSIIEVFIDHLKAKQSPAKSLAISVAQTVLTNLVTLPFGVVSARARRSPTRAEMKKKIEAALYGTFDSRLFASQDEREQKQRNKAQFIAHLDAMQDESKIKVITMALTNKAEYESLVRQLIAGFRSESKTA